MLLTPPPPFPKKNILNSFFGSLHDIVTFFMLDTDSLSLIIYYFCNFLLDLWHHVYFSLWFVICNVLFVFVFVDYFISLTFCTKLIDVIELQEFYRLRSSLQAKQEHASLLEDFKEFDRTRLDLEEGAESDQHALLKEHASISRNTGHVSHIWDNYFAFVL